MDTKVVAVIPIHGRIPLVRLTVERLLRKNGVSDVICVGQTLEEKEVTLLSGAIWLQRPNVLSDKWNAGFQLAKELKPDACLFVGSSDWISEHWVPTLLPMLKHYGVVGKHDVYMAHVDKDRTLYGHWKGYHNHKKGNLIGTGRLLSAETMDRINWTPFLPYREKSMDRMMQEKCLASGVTIGACNDSSLKSLSISHYAWQNLHGFNNGSGDFELFDNCAQLVKDFPEILEL